MNNVHAHRFPIAMGNLPQNAKPADRAVDIAGAYAVAVGPGEWSIMLEHHERMGRTVFVPVAGPGSNSSEWRGLRFGVSVGGESVAPRWILSIYANRSGELVDAPVSFVVYDLDQHAERPPCIEGCKIAGHAGECVR